MPDRARGRSHEMTFRSDQPLARVGHAPAASSTAEATSGKRNSEGLAISSPQFNLLATDGERFSLESFSPEQLLVVLFLANHCPFVAAWEDRIMLLAVEYTGRGAAFVAVSSSDPRKHPDDSLEGMRRRAQEQHYPFPYLYDHYGSLAGAIGATVTPEAFVFDRDRKLRYHGAIDSEVDERRHPTPYLGPALERLIGGKSPHVAETEPVGCPIEARN